jgi:primary-amine oxidase
VTIHQSTPTLKKYATAGAIALGLTLTANTAAWAGPVEGIQVTEVPSTNAFNSAWDAAKGVTGAVCVGQSIHFPSGSIWNLCVNTVPKFGLVISHASFSKLTGSPFITVLFDGRWGSTFVPYHPGSPRFHDIRDFNFSADTLGAGDCPSPRVLLNANTICRELRDTEIEWKTGFGGSRVRRGLEVVYTAVLGAANYSYIQEWAFRDDGTITPRAGSTGHKFFGPNDTVAHMHNITWRVDIDLNGPANNSACIFRHFELFSPPPSRATDDCLRITREAGLDWTASQFNTLKITSGLRNGRGHLTELELVPMRTGNSRNTETFTQHDFWVTRFHAGESLFAEDLPALVNGESTAGQDLVEWYTQSAHHETDNRDEKTGTTPTIWTGFELKWNSLYDGTPFF